MACRVYFCRNRSEMPEALFQVLLHQLPGPLHPEINRFQRWQDRQASLMGKLLLHHALQLYFGDADLSRLELSQRKRPFLPEGPDFNIAHSGEWVVLALAEKGNIGIDIEQKKPVDLAQYRSILNGDEWSHIQHAPDRKDAFYGIWTRKEAVCKADGMGLYRDLDQINTLQNPVTLADRTWFLRQLPVGPDYAGHLAAEHPISGCILQNVDVLRIFAHGSV